MSMMLDMLEKKLNAINVFDGNIPEIVKNIVDSIPSRTIPYRMKLALAISEIMLFTSQFKLNIKHWNDSIVPINSIMFCIAKSGLSKDSSVKAARKCFESSYEIINSIRQQNAINRAIEQARDNGYDLPEKFISYKDFYIAPNPLFVAISTNEGFLQHLNDLANDSLGSGFIYSGEIGAELASNINLTENIKALAELYDEGSKEVKILKDREKQSKEIKHLPVSALFIGSQDNILYEDTVKRKFRTEFTSKLARRSFLVFVNETIEQDEYSDLDAMLRLERKYEDNAKVARQTATNYLTELTNYMLHENTSEYITVSEDVINLFIQYKRYNEESSELINKMYPITRLTRGHLQWKALKLSGALAILDGYSEIQLQHYKAAIEFIELINKDIYEFEIELLKEPYELFADYVRYYAINNEFVIGLHELRKAGFIPLKSASLTNMKELVRLVNSYDKEGLYELENDIIKFKQLDKTDKILLSYMHSPAKDNPTQQDKQVRASKATIGYTCEEIKFKDLEEMLQGEWAYSPFRFKNGTRGKENIDSTCKWIVIDIDTTEITDEECHILLSDINHFIVRTSNPNNPNKFRILIELDSEVDVPNIQWSTFIKFIIIDLGLIGDPLGKAQIMFTYPNRTIFSQLEGNPLEVKPYLEMLSNIKPNVPITTLNTKQCNSMLDDPFTTFELAFNAKMGEGRRKLIWAVRYARELGCTKEYAINLLQQINGYWVVPLGEPDFSTMIKQISNWEFNI